LYEHPTTKVWESNPAFVARPTVEASGPAALPLLSETSRKMLNAIEAARAYIDAQNTGAWHYIRGKSNSKGEQYSHAATRPANARSCACTPETGCGIARSQDIDVPQFHPVDEIVPKAPQRWARIG